MANDITYAEYLKVDALLRLQKPLSEGPQHDEMLFITIHQTYELWFKEILHELDHLHPLLAENDLPAVMQTLKRIVAIFRVLVAQFEILTTMAPTGFISFRGALGTASGFQSRQFRELEFALGIRDDRVLQRFSEGSQDRNILEKRYRAPSVWEAVLGFFSRRGYAAGTAQAPGKEPPTATHPSGGTGQILSRIYREDPPLTNLCESLLDIDEALRKWRTHHVMMVERMIGAKHGTGGSPGVAYLSATLSQSAFPDLWAVRSEL